MRRSIPWLSVALLAAACGHDHSSCCAMAPAEIQVNVVDAAGEPVAGARVEVWREGGEARNDTTVEVSWRDAAQVRTDTTDEIGWLTFGDLPEDAYRVVVTPPRGYVFADSSRAEHTFTFGETQGWLGRFVLERAANSRTRSTP